MTRYAIVSALVVVVAGCSSRQAPPPGPPGSGNNRATILFYLNSSGDCKTITTPYVKASKAKGNMQWKLDDDDTGCLGTNVVKLEFDKGDADPLPSCSKSVTGPATTITCPLGNVSAPIPSRRYSVWVGSNKTEDPELEIAM